MAATAEVATASGASRGISHRARQACLFLAPLSAATAVAGAVDGGAGGIGASLTWLGPTLVWAAAAATLLVRRRDERLGLLALWFSMLAAVAALASAFPGPAESNAAALVQALAVAVLPAAVLHLLLALPFGALATRERRFTVAIAYGAAAGVGLLLWASRPPLAIWPIAIEALVAAAVAIHSLRSRYRATRGDQRLLLDWAALAIVLIAELVVVFAMLEILVGWPPDVLEAAGTATVAIPLALLAETSRRLRRSADALLGHAVSLAALTAVVAVVYLLVVVALGRTPTRDERALLVLSATAAAISALLFGPAQRRLAALANRVRHGTRNPPNELLRHFSSRLSRSVPLEELLLQLAESLRSVLALEAAEVWTGSGGTLERVVSEPDRGPASLRLGGEEEAVVARAEVSGRARIAVWLPQLLQDRDEALVRVAPITSAGEFLGLIVAERAPDGEPFDEEVEDVLAELARQVGLALRNVRLDSDLQASLDEVRRQADELRGSRARIVAAADAERRRIERDLHDGAQQYLVGLAVNLGVARTLSESQPEAAKAILDELRDTVQEAVDDFRDLAHGIYPPLLQDRGLPEALANAARRAGIPTHVAAREVRRYDPGVEAAVYFCCLESLQNAAKYAGDGARATVRVWESEDSLLFEVADDGSGYEPGGGAAGAGLTNMRDRVGAIGGSLRVESAPGHGTRVTGAIPLDRQPSRSAR